MRGQALAIAFVIAGGVSVYLVAAGLLSSLQETRRAYYERYRFADVWAPVVRAPNGLLDEIRAIEGVQAAEARVRAPGPVRHAEDGRAGDGRDFLAAGCGRAVREPDLSRARAAAGRRPARRGRRAAELCRCARARDRRHGLGDRVRRPRDAERCRHRALARARLRDRAGPDRPG